MEAQLQAATRRVGGVWAPMTEWPTVYRGPPLAVDREREYGMPTEEERRTPGYLEVAAAVAAVPAVHYALPAMVPHTPQEAPHEAVTGPPPISIPCPRLDPPPVLVRPPSRTMSLKSTSPPSHTLAIDFGIEYQGQC